MVPVTPSESTRPLRLAIVGRPNVGKSTLFNRLAGRRAALVHDQPGVTRDRREAPGRLGDLALTIVDTAGLEDADEDAIEGRMRRQSMQAVVEADVALFLFDARAGVTPVDAELARELRRNEVPIVLVANKCEGRAAQTGLLDAWELGLGDPVAVSAEHGLGMSDLQEAVAAAAVSYDQLEPDPEPEPDPESKADAETDSEAMQTMSLAIVGRPNAGKSTLMNRLLGEERVITGPEPGLTRDSISIDWAWKDRPIRLIDTAGVRRRARVAGDVEQLSVMDTFRAIRFADIVALMIDCTTVQDFGHGIEKQDLTIARQVEEEGRALVIVANKWDLVTDAQGTRRKILESLEGSLSQLKGVALVTMSAAQGSNLEKLMSTVIDTYDKWNLRVTTGQLNRWLADVTEAFPPPLAAGRRVRIRYMTQAKARPPTFALFVNKPQALPDSYMRYLTNKLRESFGFHGVPLRLHMRKPKNPYVEDDG